MILNNAIQAEEYFFSTMVKNETIEKIQTGQVSGDIVPELKWLNAESSWLARYVWSGNLQCTLMSKGFVFISFIDSQTNSKETIVVYGQGRKFIEALKWNSSNGVFYLRHVSKANFSVISGLNNYTTSSLSVFLSFALLPNIPKEISNLSQQYLNNQKEYLSINNVKLQLRSNMGKYIRSLEKKIGFKYNSEFKSLVYGLLNKTSPAELTQESISALKKVILEKGNNESITNINNLRVVKTARKHNGFFKNLVLLITMPEVLVFQVAKKATIKTSKEQAEKIVKQNVSNRIIKGQIALSRTRQQQNKVSNYIKKTKSVIK